MNKIYLPSGRAYLCSTAEADDHPDVLKAKFVVCDFSINRNGTRLNRDTIANWMGTLIGKPLVGKLSTPIIGETDFTGHNQKVVVKRDKDNKEYKTLEFDTQAFGVFTDVSIESIDEHDCIVASCDIWKRFPKACAVIQKRIENDTLNTSWEIDIITSHTESVNTSSVHVIDDGIFTAHCLLGKNAVPAYECSRLLEVAETEEQAIDVNEELISAYTQDMSDSTNSNEEEKTILKKEKTDIASASATSQSDINADVASPDASAEHNGTASSESDSDERKPEANDTDENQHEEQATDSSGTESATSESSTHLTMLDLNNKVRKAVSQYFEDRRIYDYWHIEFNFPLEQTIWVADPQRKSELDYLVFTYIVTDTGEVVLSPPQSAQLSVSIKDMNTKFDEMAAAIATANNQLNEKDKVIAELSPYKEQAEKAEADRKKAERAEKVKALRQYAIGSKLINEVEVSEGGAFVDMIENLDENGIKTVIAERYMATCNAESSVQKNTETASNHTSNESVQCNLSDTQDQNSGVKDYRRIMDSYLGSRK